MSKVEELVSVIKNASDEYYNTGNSVMSDAEFDTVVEQLRALDPNNELLKKIGATPTGEIVQHTIPVGSQEKLKTDEEIQRWCQKVSDMSGTLQLPFVVQHKLDGSTMVLYYEAGNLIRAVTRGDGRQGEDQTRNVLRIKNVKKKLPIPWTGQLRGEVLLDIKEFKEYFAPLGYKNPRNAANGVIRDKKGTDLLKHLRICYFDVVESEVPPERCTEQLRLEFIEKTLGLEHVWTEAVDTTKQVVETFYEVQKERPNLGFEIDGVIVRANLMVVQAELGMSSDLRPEGQRCIKFTASGAATKLLSVELTIGHTGAIIPTGKVSPIDIGGVTISSVLLNNFEDISRSGVELNDLVFVTRRGDVIPHLEYKVASLFRCPDCGFEGTEEEQKAHHAKP